MTFNVSEQHALLGAASASIVPTIANELGLERLIVSFADAVFEGDRGSAAFVTSIGFAAVGAALALMAVLGPVSGYLGMLAMGIGGGFAALGIQTFLGGDN